MPQRIEKYLVIDSGGYSRIVARTPHLKWNEVMYKLVVTIPDGWGRLAGTIQVSLPTPVLLAAEPVTWAPGGEEPAADQDEGEDVNVPERP